MFINKTFKTTNKTYVVVSYFNNFNNKAKHENKQNILTIYRFIYHKHN